MFPVEHFLTNIYQSNEISKNFYNFIDDVWDEKSKIWEILIVVNQKLILKNLIIYHFHPFCVLGLNDMFSKIVVFSGDFIIPF